MKNVLKWGAIICAGIIVVVIAALLIIPMFVDVQKYKPELEKWVSETTGRPFSVGDDLDLSLFPWAGVSFSDLHLGNMSDFAEKDFVTIKSFEVRLKLLPLIFKDIQVKRFVLNDPRIVLVKNKNGRVNWEFPKTTTAAEKDAEAPVGKTSGTGLPISSLTVGDFSLINGIVLWIDHSTNTRKELAQINLALKDVSLDRPVKLVFSAQMDKQPLSLEGSVGPVASGLKGGSVPMDLSVKALKELNMRLKGGLENPTTTPSVDVDIEVAEFSPRKLIAALGQTFPVATSDPKALNRVTLKAHVKANSENISISNGILNLDESKLHFTMKASEFSRPVLAFDLNLDQINLDRYIPPQTEKKPAAEQQAQEAKKKTDYTPLRRLVMDGQLKIGKLTVSKAKIQDIFLKVTAKNGIVNLDPLKLKMYQGDVAGKASLNVKKDIPQSAFSLNVNNIQINPLLQDVLEKNILEGATKAQLTLAMMGDDPALIKKTLNGEGMVLFNDGAIVGIDLASMVRNVQAAFAFADKPEQKPRTDFAELKAPFTIKNGLVNTPQTSLKSPLLRIIAAGNADLVKETLDFRVEPKAVDTIKGQGDETLRSGIMVPVVVTGNFSSPKFRPDLKDVAKQQLKEKVLESDEAKKLLEKEELKPLKEQSKGLLKGLLGQ
jgi:AsmA protein